MTSNVEEETSVEIGVVANSIVRVYQERHMKEKHAIWSLRDLEVSMCLKGLRRVVRIYIRTRSCGGKHEPRNNEGSKFLDQGDGGDESGTYTNFEKLCSGGVKGGHENWSWHCEVRGKDMVLVPLEGMDELKMEGQRQRK